MKTMRFNLTTVLFAVLGLAASSLAQGQASRTWVSGVGDDVNPCSRTAPCKTFAGAISKTAEGGEISVLDPGGYGAVTITKSMTIDGGTGSGWASIVDAGTNGITVNVQTNVATSSVTLRNISIDGTPPTSPGINGIRIIAGATVFIENCQIFGHSQRGISDERTTAGTLLFVDNTIVRDNASSGIVILNGGAASGVDASIHNSQINGNGNSGVVAGSGARVTLHNSVAAGNVNYGVYAEAPSGATFLFVGDTALHENGVGIQVGGGAPVVVLSNNTITNNGTGMALAGAASFSFGNNKIGGNIAGNGPFGMNGLAIQ
jgi:parallel beta-helix repeat protein